MSVTMIKANKELDKVTRYKMTIAQDILKMSDYVGEIIDVQNVAIFDDVREDKTTRVCSVMDIDGKVYATNSKTFMENIEDISDLFTENEAYSIKINKGTSKNGREFIFCTLETD